MNKVLKELEQVKALLLLRSRMSVESKCNGAEKPFPKGAVKIRTENLSKGGESVDECLPKKTLVITFSIATN
jgi:hypothetical protein